MRECEPIDTLKNGWKIVAFGASVTQQKRSYIDKLGKKFGSWFMRYGYGGDHLTSSGVSKIDKVLESCPTHCFIDWLSTGYKETNQNTIDCLETIVQKFSDIDCKLIFLFMPRKDHEERIIFYDFVKKFLVSNDLFFIDLNDHISWSNKICRDEVHLTVNGAKKYADIIYDLFMKSEKNISVPKCNFSPEQLKIKTLEINETAYEYVKLSGQCEIISFELKVGRHSGLIRAGSHIFNTWDIWSHYDRIADKSVENLIVDGKLKLEILQDEFDTTKCRRDGIDFTEYTKHLKIENVFYIGDSLKCEEIK